MPKKENYWELKRRISMLIAAKAAPEKSNQSGAMQLLTDEAVRFLENGGDAKKLSKIIQVGPVK